VDAVVEEGTSELDESVVTGESLPVSKAPGDELIGGSINKNGTLRARATRVARKQPGSDREARPGAQSSKAPGSSSRIGRVLARAGRTGRGTLTLIVWLLAGRTFSQAILFAITVVVITCPDALGLATRPRSCGHRARRQARDPVQERGRNRSRRAVQVVVMDKTER